MDPGQPRLSELLHAIGHRGSEAAPARRFGEGGRFALEVASSILQRRRAWAMVYQSYLAKEFAEPNRDRLWYGLHDALPSTTTFNVTSRGREVSTLTVAFDSPALLPADTLYHDVLDGLRGDGRRPCEIISLASAGVSFREGTDALKELFRLAYLTAIGIEHATDMIITVNPRHTAFYERTLQFSAIGETRSYAKVSGAPAVLMRLELDTARAKTLQAFGDAPGSLHHFFHEADEIPELRSLLAAKRTPLAEADLIEWFVRRRAIIPEAPQAARDVLLESYPRLAVRMASLVWT